MQQLQYTIITFINSVNRCTACNLLFTRVSNTSSAVLASVLVPLPMCVTSAPITSCIREYTKCKFNKYSNRAVSLVRGYVWLLSVVYTREQHAIHSHTYTHSLAHMHTETLRTHIHTHTTHAHKHTHTHTHTKKKKKKHT